MTNPMTENQYGVQKIVHMQIEGIALEIKHTS